MLGLSIAIGQSAPLAASGFPGPNLVLNGTFNDSSVWSTGVGVTISGGVCNATGAGTLCYQPITYSNGGTYQVDLDYTCTSGSKLRIDLSAGANSDLVIVSGALTTDGASHHLTLTFTANVGSGFLAIEADSATFTGTIDNVTLVRTA